MKVVSKLLLVVAVVFSGFQSAQAACMNDKAFCYKIDIYAGLYMNTPENTDHGYATTNTYGRSDVKVVSNVAEKDGWKATGTLKLELNTKGDGATNKADEVYLDLSSGGLSIIAGWFNLKGDGYNGSDLGGAYLTEESGSSWLGVYGDKADDAPTLAVTYKVLEALTLKLGLIEKQNEHTTTDASGTTTSANLQSQIVDFIAVYSASGLAVSFEIENASETDNDVADAKGITAGDSTSEMGLGLQYTAGMFAPFAAYGTSNDGTNTATNTLVGIDLHDVAGMGITVGTELGDDGTGNGEAGVNTWTNTFFALKIPMGPGSFTAGYAATDRVGSKVVASQVVFEFAVHL
ncbi:porin [Deltaproteobacteria bacterium TL4]